MCIDDIKNKTFDERKIYDVKNERGNQKCKLIQQTDFLFIFQPLYVESELDKRTVCIGKVDWFLRKDLVRDSC